MEGNRQEIAQKEMTGTKRHRLHAAATSDRPDPTKVTPGINRLKSLLATASRSLVSKAVPQVVDLDESHRKTVRTETTKIEDHHARIAVAVRRPTAPVKRVLLTKIHQMPAGNQSPLAKANLSRNATSQRNLLRKDPEKTFRQTNSHPEMQVSLRNSIGVV